VAALIPPEKCRVELSDRPRSFTSMKLMFIHRCQEGKLSKTMLRSFIAEHLSGLYRAHRNKLNVVVINPSSAKFNINYI
jgi:hypothetical protein